MAMSGNSGATTSSFCSQRMVRMRPPRSVNTSARITVSMMSPYMATIRWYDWNTRFTGMSATSTPAYLSVCAREFRPWYSVSHVPVARKLVPPGMANGVMTC